jgi:hypothetical protein
MLEYLLVRGIHTQMQEFRHLAQKLETLKDQKSYNAILSL